MSLLKEGIKKGLVIETNRAVKMYIDGITETYPIYQVHIDLLYFNDRNDRVATWISQYKSDNHVSAIDMSDIVSYNSIIHNFIVESNPDKIKTTQKNIELIGQQKHGVVLNDGRVIDGNRRFTCLRNLSEKDPRFSYFETIILEKNIENNAKQIKMLELQIQLGEDEKVDYNPIDKYAGMYRDIVESGLLTVSEYARSTNQSEANVKKQLEVANLLVEFLDAIKAPMQFHIARDLQLNNPLQELNAVLKQIGDEDKKQQMKYIVFTNFLMQPEKDMTRFIRNLKGIANSPYLDEFIEQEIDIADDVMDSIPENEKVTSETIADIKADEEVKNSLVKTMDVVSNKVKATETRNQPNRMLMKAVDNVEAIDPKIIRLLTDDQKDDLTDNLEHLNELINELKKYL